MIIEYTPPAEGDRVSRWYMGNATLLLPLGHGEYGIPDNDKVQVELWDAYDREDGKEPPRWLAAHEEALRLAGGNYAEPLPSEGDATGWGTLALLTGSVYELWRMFYQFANQLDPEQDPAGYTPGGDDDTFDYYPSGFECMEAWAGDMDGLQERWAAFLREWLSTQPEHMQRIWMGDATHGFTARHRIVEIVRNLRTAKGNFREWEFEDYAKPYAEEAGVRLDEPTSWETEPEKVQ